MGSEGDASAVRESGDDDPRRSHVDVRKRPANASHASTPSTLPSLPTGIPTDLHLALLLNKTVLSSAAILVRQWLLTGHSEALHQAHHQHSAAPRTPATDADDTSSAPFVVQGTTLPLRIASPWAIATTVFVLAALGQAVWLQVWTWLPSLRRSDPNFRVLPRKIGTLGVVMFVSTWVWLMALERLGPTTVIIFTQFCDVWMADLARSVRFRAHGSYIVVAGIMLSFVCQLIFPPSAIAIEQAASFPYDDLDNPLPPSLRHTRPMHLASPSTLRANSLRAELEAKAYSPSGLLFGHLLLVIFAVLSLERERATRNASLEAGGRRRAQVLACIAIAAPAFAASLMGVAVGLPSLPPLSSLIPSFDTSATTASGHSAAYILLAFGLLILEPLVGAALEPHATLTARVTQGWPLAVGAAIIVGKIGFSSRLLWSELVVALVVAYGIRSILKTSPVHALDDVEKSTARNGSRMFSSNFDGSVRATHKRTTSDPALQDAWQSVFVFLAVAKDMVKKVWAKQDSRKIFQFLVLNLLFMFVQLVWGVWTNSLGLISDAIHMFFDCLAIGMGLLASVMQDWKHDRTFTYGYGRIETLSGFANGIFLLLISTFIVFEGIDRIVHPPEMHNTRQLLIVSSMGLGVNLFGMFAMGGHHHHGHGHSHGHSHGGHAHDHAHADDHKGHHHHDDHSHDHAHTHAHSDHQHSHDDHDHHDHGHNDHGHDHHDHGHDHGHHHHSHNMLGIYLHVMADTLGSVGVIISTLLIQYFGWTGFDPIASLVIAFLIVGSVIPLVIDAGRILCLDLGPNREVEVTSALDALKTIEGLASFSAPHFWPKDAETVVGTLRVQMTMMLVSVEATPSTTTTASTVSSTFSNGMSSKDTSLTSLASEASGGDDDSPTFPTSAASAATPLSGTAAVTTSNGISASASTSLNGVNGTSPPPTVPVVSPERLAAQVEALLKKRIHGLESLTVQCERSNVVIAPTMNGHRTKLVAVQG